MEENKNNEFEMNSNVNQTTTTTTKQKKSKVVPTLVLIIVILILLLALCVGNMYALSKDYDNVFAMVTSMVSRKEAVNGEGNIVSDGKNDLDQTETLKNKLDSSTISIEGKECLNFIPKEGITRKYTIIEDTREDKQEEYGIKISKSGEKLYLTLISDGFRNLAYYDVNIEQNNEYEITNINVSNIKSIYVSEHGNGLNYPVALFLMNDGTVEWLNVEETLVNRDFATEGKIENVINVVRIAKANVGEHYEISNDGAGWLSVIGIREDGNFYDLVDATINYSDETEKIKEVLQDYLDLSTSATSASKAMLEKLNLVDEIEYTYIDETMSHAKTNVEYSTYKGKMLNYVTESWFDERFGKFYYEKDGLLCCFFDGGTTGEKEVKSISLKEGSTYTAEIYVTNLTAAIDEQKPIRETIEFTVENSNEKCVISHCDY